MEREILATLAYADIFDFPLKEAEIWQWLIGNPNKSRIINPNKSEWEKIFESIRGKHSDKLGYKEGFYFLAGRQSLVAIRKKRAAYSVKKLALAEKIANLLRIVPTIKMVGVTGALAQKNCQKDDDIDLMIITATRTLWLTRLLTTVFVELTGQRRHPHDKKVSDKICLNMFVDEEHLEVPPGEQDLYTAHEVVQVKPLWDRGQTSQKFLAANLWVKNDLPNTLSTTHVDTKNHEEKVSGASCPYSWLLVLERLAKHLQLWYMGKRRTTEVISEGLIRFHPQDARVWVLKEYRKRIRAI